MKRAAILPLALIAILFMATSSDAGAFKDALKEKFCATSYPPENTACTLYLDYRFEPNDKNTTVDKCKAACEHRVRIPATTATCKMYCETMRDYDN